MLFMVPYYPMVGFTGGATFFAYWVHLSMHVLWQAYFGQLMSYLLPTVEVATVFGVLMQMIFFLFCGFNPPGASIPQGYKWLYEITPHKYSLALVASLVFGDCPRAAVADGDAGGDTITSVGGAGERQVEHVLGPTMKGLSAWWLSPGMMRGVVEGTTLGSAT
ncbi:hypothetical protein JG688_00014961 [Phytophthora aleatoria]|uniref:ABC-2 type transporter transmembrane domain-containing protein n=1 Tax=Phytophthora aleatoria TaxID=2496075 RepID=A0A8J5MDP0_9STRA|nr:hypothetical protein JG688_00014961 [Phytophthora aleatoria]